MHIIILISLIIIQTQAISVGPVVVTNKQIPEWKFKSMDGLIAYNDEINKQLETYGISNFETDNILKKIQYLTEEGKYESNQWTFTITKNLGKLSIVNINAEINNGEISIGGTEKEYSTTIPKLTKQEEVCARTGSRKYVIGGPRRMKCHTVIVERGITSEEMDEVRNILIEHASKDNNLIA
jgi:hypothetical protein